MTLADLIAVAIKISGIYLLQRLTRHANEMLSHGEKILYGAINAEQSLKVVSRWVSAGDGVAR